MWTVFFLICHWWGLTSGLQTIDPSIFKDQSGGGERERIVDQGGENCGSERLGWSLGSDYSHFDYFDWWVVLFSYFMYQYLLRICSNSLKLQIITLFWWKYLLRNCSSSSLCVWTPPRTPQASNSFQASIFAPGKFFSSPLLRLNFHHLFAATPIKLKPQF